MANEYSERIEKTIEQNKEKYIDYLLKLVSIDTHDIGHGIEGGLEKEGQEYLMQVFEQLDADEILKDPLKEESILKCNELYQEGNTGHNYENRFNVYATIKGASDKSLLFNGHIDHMPADNLENWKIDPLKPEVIDDQIVGLGVADMKAGLMAGIMAGMVLKDAGIELPVTVKYASVCDEEGGGNGSLCAAMSGVKADAVVVCEPTNYEVIAAHMGWVFFQVEVPGIAVHSGLKLAGVNAIEKAGLLMEAIDKLEHKWLLKYKHPLLPPPSSNVGVIYGGEAGSTIPDYCCFKTCVHYLPNVMSREQVIQEYTDAIFERCRGDEWLKDHMPKVTTYQMGNPFEMELDHPFVGVFMDAYKNALGRDVRVVGSPAGCDSRTWHNIVKCPTLQYGPGSLEQCHAVNEFVTVDQYLDAIKIYANLIMGWADKREPAKEYFEMQELGRKAIDYARSIVKPGMNLRELRALCEQFLLDNGADSFWWCNVGAFLFSGDETAVSVVPDVYEASDRYIEENDIITIDLSPQRNGVWGDFARTIILEDGKVVSDISKIKNEEWRNGLLMEEYLHETLVDIADEDMTFEELHERIEAVAEEKGYVNLDCLGNFGHSIAKRDEDRIYSEQGNKAKLSSVAMFTFEPHISLPGSKYGFKKEDIYYFSDGRLKRM